MSATFKRILSALLLTAIAIGATTTAAAALTTRYVGGGTWRYGTESNYAHSRYYHPTECHSATVQRTVRQVGTVVAADRDVRGPKSWARAGLLNTGDYLEQAYWNDEASC
ncbi:lactococcin 972 family bacteriocin [Nocardiopsis sp. CNT312]|uniref:lactococcin 972 family bacteriocin n=1 Tax=Nocardiopsis sp. CNT312 TaxID=1137268 RepID=UPI0004B9C80C|nr:lactococcin 972 family bacteriocin [Nocardiopsis sp. CNT312]